LIDRNSVTLSRGNEFHKIKPQPSSDSNVEFLIIKRPNMPEDYHTTAALYDHSTGNYVIQKVKFICGIFNEWDKMDKLILGHG